ncbi:hypothetical protein, partial [Salmonella sp. s54925]|uniref:hypothetical protein n=1 Tax=Salmonella sp. s54925 TaxID=3159674 RepID=UPI00397EFD8D
DDKKIDETRKKNVVGKGGDIKQQIAKPNDAPNLHGMVEQYNKDDDKDDNSDDDDDDDDDDDNDDDDNDDDDDSNESDDHDQMVDDNEAEEAAYSNRSEQQ